MAKQEIYGDLMLVSCERVGARVLDAKWLCVCGKEVEIKYSFVRSGRATSCGCMSTKTKDWGLAEIMLDRGVSIITIATTIQAKESTVRKWASRIKKSREKAPVEPLPMASVKPVSKLTLLENEVKENLAGLGRTTGAHVVFEMVRNGTMRAMACEALERLVKRGVIIRDPADYIKLAG